MAEGNNNSTYEAKIKTEFNKIVDNDNKNESSEPSLKNKEARTKAELFLIESCKNLPEEQRKILIQKIADKLIYFEAEKEKIEDECKNYLEELGDEIYIYNDIKEYGILKTHDDIKNNPQEIRNNPESLKLILQQIKEINPEILNIFSNDLLFKKEYESIMSGNYSYINTYQIYSISSLFLELSLGNKINDFKEIFHNLKQGNTSEAIKILKNSFSDKKYRNIFNLDAIKKLSLEDKKEEINELKSNISDIQDTNEEMFNITMSYFGEMSKTSFQILNSNYKNNLNKQPEDVVKNLIELGVDYYDIGKYYAVLMGNIGSNTNEQIYNKFKQISEITDNQTKIKDDVSKKITKHGLIDDFETIFVGKELSAKKEQKFLSLINNSTKNGEIRGVLEFKEGLKEIFKGTEFENKIDKMSAGDFLQLLIDYNETKIAKNVETMKSCGFDDEKFKKLSEKEIDEILELNKDGKIDSVIERLILLGIINKPKNKEELELIKTNLNEFLNKTNQNKVFKKNLVNPERLGLLQDVFDGKIIEGSKEYTEKLTKIQEKEKTEEIAKALENKNDLLNLDKIKIGDIQVIKNQEFDITYIRNTDGNFSIKAENTNINCKPEQVENIIKDIKFFQENKLDFLIPDMEANDFKGEILNSILSKKGEVKLDLSDGIEDREKELILNTFKLLLFRGNGKNENIGDLSNYFKGKTRLEITSKMQEKGLMNEGQSLNKTNLINSIKTNII